MVFPLSMFPRDVIARSKQILAWATWRVASAVLKSWTGVWTEPTAVIPWPLFLKPKVVARAGREGTVEAAIAANATSSGRPPNQQHSSGSRSISRGTSESNPRSNATVAEALSASSATAPARAARIAPGAAASATVSAAASATAARTAFKGMGPIMRLFQVWSARAFSVRVPRSTSCIKLASSRPVHGRASWDLFMFWILRQFWEQAASTITASRRAAGPVWTACSV